MKKFLGVLLLLAAIQHAQASTYKNAATTVCTPARSFIVDLAEENSLGWPEGMYKFTLGTGQYIILTGDRSVFFHIGDSIQYNKDTDTFFIDTISPYQVRRCDNFPSVQITHPEQIEATMDDLLNL